MTSVNRVLPFTSSSSIPELPSSSTTTSDHLCVIGLIPHLNLNASRLQQILQGDPPHVSTFSFSGFYLYVTCQFIEICTVKVNLLHLYGKKHLSHVQLDRVDLFRASMPSVKQVYV